MNAGRSAIGFETICEREAGIRQPAAAKLQLVREGNFASKVSCYAFDRRGGWD
jgi:hypothetical protein